MAIKKEIEMKLKSTLDGKGVDEAKQKVDALNNSSKQLDKSSQQAARGLEGMGQGALTAAYFFDDLQYGIRGIMNNIPALVMGFGGGAGLAGALSLAVLAGSKLYDWLGGASNKSADLAKKAKEQSKEIAEAYRQSMRENYQALQEFNKEERTKTVNKEYQDYVKGLTSEYEKQTNEIKEQLDLRKREIAYRENIKTADLERQKAQTDLFFERGEISKRQRDTKMLEIDQEFERRRENSQISIAEREFKALNDELSEKEYLLGQQGIELSNIYNAKTNLPTTQEILNAFIGESRTRRGMQELNKKRNDFLIDPDQYNKEYGALFEDNKKFSSLIQNSIETLRRTGVSFIPSYENGKNDLDRAQEYAKSIDALNKKQEELKKSSDVLSKSLNSLQNQISGKRKEIENLEEVRGIRDETRKTRLSVFNEQKDREEKNNFQRDRLKQLENDLKEDKANFESTIENFIVSAGKSANEQQRSIVRKASEAIRDQVKKAASDGEIDTREYQQIGIAFRDALREQGVSANSVLNGLVSNLREGLSVVNIQSSKWKELRDEVEQLKKVLDQIKNDVGGLRRRKH